VATMDIACFTDIEGYTAKTEAGHRFTRPVLAEFLRVGKALIEACGGNCKKNLGDAHMAIFHGIEDAFRFATQFQQYYHEQPCLERDPLRVRVSLYLGVVDETQFDAFGSGVNRGARLGGITGPGKVLLNDELRQAICRVWGEETTSEYTEYLGEFVFAGVSDPQTVHEFRWGAFAKKNPDSSLAERVFYHLECADVEPTNLSVRDLAQPGLVIWPAVPRRIATSIHRAQVEIVRLLALLGWRTRLLVADCGAGIYADRKHADNFIDAVQRHASYRGLRALEPVYLSEFFSPRSPDQEPVLKLFQRITAKLKVQDLIDMNQKSYAIDIETDVLLSRHP